MTGCNVISSCDRVNGTISCAKAASDTLIGIDLELEQALTYARRTLLVNDMSNILISDRKSVV